MTDNGSPADANAASESAEEFPSKLRVHALARFLGLTSRQVLAHLANLGVQTRSPQSSVDRDLAKAVAERVRSGVDETGETPPQAAPAGALWALDLIDAHGRLRGAITAMLSGVAVVDDLDQVVGRVLHVDQHPGEAGAGGVHEHGRVGAEDHLADGPVQRTRGGEAAEFLDDLDPVAEVEPRHVDPVGRGAQIVQVRATRALTSS